MSDDLKAERLQALGDRGRNSAPGDSAYSAIVGRLRWMLPLAVLAIVAILMIWPKVQEELSALRFSAAPLDEDAIEQAAKENRLLNANFSALDSEGRPFTLLADEAIQQTKSPDHIVLDNPSGGLKLDGDSSLAIRARHGLYKQEAQHLDLRENVVITRSDGTVMTTDTLFIDLARNDARTSDPVTVDGPQGNLTATGMIMHDGGAITIFEGPAKLILRSETSIDPKGKS